MAHECTAMVAMAMAREHTVREAKIRLQHTDSDIE